MGTHEDDRTVLYKTKSLDGTKPNLLPLNPNTNPIQLFYAFFEHHPLIFKLDCYAVSAKQYVSQCLSTLAAYSVVV